MGIAVDKNQPKDAEVPEYKLQNGISKDDDAWCMIVVVYGL